MHLLITEFKCFNRTQTFVEKIGRSEELSGFKCGTVMGSHLLNISACEISMLLDSPQSAILLASGSI